MQTLSEIRTLLAERGLRPKHRLGQNFLHDKNQIAKLIGAADLQQSDLVVEVGPGTGTLTEALLEAGAQVICCEIDAEMAAIIEERLGDRVTLIVGDCLHKGRTLNPEIVSAIAGRGRPFKLVANLPYQAASPLMTTLLIDHSNCTGQFITVQKEVADRILAGPGSKTYGPLGIIVQALADVERIGTVGPSCFWPQPKVTSAMIRIVPQQGDRPSDARAFAAFVTKLFSSRRKQLGTIFGRQTSLPNGISAEARPDALSVAQLIELHKLLGRGG